MSYDSPPGVNKKNTNGQSNYSNEKWKCNSRGKTMDK